MNKLHTILVFGAIFAAGLGAVSVNDQAISAFIIPAQFESYSQGILMLGHVEIVVHDSEGNVVQYSQGDNIIVTTGGDCIASALFSGGNVGDCTSFGNFDYIAIGNGTGSTVAVGDFRLDPQSDDGIAISGSVHEGEMARKQVAPGFNVVGTDTVVTLSNTSAFTFTTTNATIIEQSALFNANGSPNSNGETTAIGGEILAMQDLTPAVIVSDGD